jgi:ribA/ribD-fused uncharacterized protein
VALDTTQVTPRAIDSFDGPWRFLSNFHPAVVHLDGVAFPTVEHAFQAAKTVDSVEREMVRSASTPGRAKRAGRKVTLRPGWDDIRVEVMAALVAEKFRHPHLADALLATGEAVLVEGNHWGDTFWGVSGGQGTNHLGRILTEVRAGLRCNTWVFIPENDREEPR